MEKSYPNILYEKFARLVDHRKFCDNKQTPASEVNTIKAIDVSPM